MLIAIKVSPYRYPNTKKNLGQSHLFQTEIRIVQITLRKIKAYMTKFF